MRKIFFVICLYCFISFSVYADDTKYIEYLSLSSVEEVSFIVGEGDDMIAITRVMRPCGRNKGYLQPMSPAKGVKTLTEVDMLHALNDEDGMIVDMRLESNYLAETIPTAVNFPYVDIADHMGEFGCVKKTKGQWDCSKAKTIYAFCNGPACTQSPTGIRTIIGHGFPAEKIFYYRGGMLVWSAIGLTTVEGDF